MSNRTSWAGLTTSLQFEILEIVAQVHLGSALSLAPYATVCLTWQSFFENVTFRRLTIEYSPTNARDLRKFSDAVQGTKKRRLAYIHHIWLRIKLWPYDCPECREKEDGATIERNNIVFTGAVQGLLQAISAWKQGDGNTAGGLVLEISAHSPSDTKHFYKDFRMDDEYPFRTEEDIVKTGSIREYHKEKRRQNKAEGAPRDSAHDHNLATLEATDRFLGAPLDLISESALRLPRAEIVQGLLFRKVYKRKPSPVALERLLRESLVCLVWFRFERSHPRELATEISFLQDFRKHVLPAFPKTLERLYYFASTGGPWHNESRLWLPLICEEHKQIPPVTPAELVDKYGLALKEFFWSQGRCHPSDARMQLQRSFVIQDGMDDPWSKLEKVSISTSALGPCIPQALADGDLYWAACAVAKMPKLQIMELHYIGRITFCVLRYKTRNDQPTLTLVRTFDRSPTLSKSVVRAWTRSALVHSKNALEVSTQNRFWDRRRSDLESLETDVMHPLSKFVSSVRASF